jgi:translation initiation factor IF-1
MMPDPDVPERSPKGEALVALVVAKLNNGLFRVRTLDGREAVAHSAKESRMTLTRLLCGDQVVVELSPFDPAKARICGSTAQHPHHEFPEVPLNSEYCREGQS